jgi:hypothetical protein
MDYQTPIDDNAGNVVLENYLDELCAPLHDLPQEAQDEIRQEIGAHLQSLIAMKREPNRVLESALQQFGDPSEIGRLLALEWENREWDLSGLSLLERIQKIRDAATQTTTRGNWQATTPEKRSRWQTLLVMSPALLLGTPCFLFLAQESVPHSNLGLIRVLDVAIALSSGLALIFSLALAWHDWHHARNQKRSKISRIQHALAQVAMGFFSLMPLMFSYNVPDAELYWLIVPMGMIALMIILTAFEPSRRTKLAFTASIGWGGVCGLLLIPGSSRLLTVLGITSVWVQLLVLCPVFIVLGRGFWKGKAPAKRQQNVG